MTTKMSEGRYAALCTLQKIVAAMESEKVQPTPEAVFVSGIITGLVGVIAAHKASKDVGKGRTMEEIAQLILEDTEDILNEVKAEQDVEARAKSEESHEE